MNIRGRDRISGAFQRTLVDDDSRTRYNGIMKSTYRRQLIFQGSSSNNDIDSVVSA